MVSFNGVGGLCDYAHVRVDQSLIDHRQKNETPQKLNRVISVQFSYVALYALLVAYNKFGYLIIVEDGIEAGTIAVKEIFIAKTIVVFVTLA